MPYMIEKADLARDGRISSQSILTDGKKVTAIRPGLPKYSFMKMDTEGFIMAPAFSILDGSLSEEKGDIRKAITGKYIMNGALTVVTYANVEYERELEMSLKTAESRLSCSPADYAIGVKIPLKSLTPAFLRRCKRLKLPAVFVELESREGLEQIPWGWIKEAMFPVNCPLVPVTAKVSMEEKRLILSKWEKIMISERIPSIRQELKECTPLSAAALNSMGIFPARSSLLHNSELSYNLYSKGEEVKTVDDVTMFLYHRDRLAVTVLRGKVIRAGEETEFSSIKGEYIKVKTHFYYSL